MGSEVEFYGKIINDKYKIEEVLDKGTFGIVYPAININKKVVLIFLKENWSDEETSFIAF